MLIPRPRFSRGTVVGLLLLATTINYIDRQSLSVLAPFLQRELHISTLQYSYAVDSFLAVYAVMYLLSGRAVDHLGTRWGLGLAVIWWSIAEMLHAAVVGIKSLCIFRALLAIGEAAVIPSGVKAVAECFASEERGVAVGTFEMGLSLGPVFAPPLVVWITLHRGWKEAFLWTGAAGLIWALFWMWFYQVPSRIISDGERGLDPKPPPATMKWVELFSSKEVWGVGSARFFSDPIWYFYLFWLPKYMADDKGLTLKSIGAFAWIPYCASLVGGLSGGAASSWLVKRGVGTVKARQSAMLLSSLLVSFGVLSAYLESLLWVMVVVSLAAFAMQFWGANLDTLPIDLFPPEHVAQTVGFAGFLGAVGGIIFNSSTGYVVEHYSYAPVWIASALTYPIGFLLLFVLLRQPSVLKSGRAQHSF